MFSKLTFYWLFPFKASFFHLFCEYCMEFKHKIILWYNIAILIKYIIIHRSSNTFLTMICNANYNFVLNRVLILAICESFFISSLLLQLNRFRTYTKGMHETSGYHQGKYIVLTLERKQHVRLFGFLIFKLERYHCTCIIWNVIVFSKPVIMYSRNR